MEREEVKRLLMTMEAIYPNFKIGDLQITLDAWSEILSDQDPRKIFSALSQYSRTSQSDFAPSPGKLIQLAYDMCNSKNEISPSEAWSMVYKALCNSAYNAEAEFKKLPAAVQKAVGSPDQLRVWGLDADFNEGVASSNFRKTYSTVCERIKAEALMAPEVKQFLETTSVKCLESKG